MIEDYKARRAINFDFDTRLMRAQDVYPKGYGQVKRFFKKHGFIHRQWSGYLSIDELLLDNVIDIVTKLIKQFPWVESCTRKIDLTDYQLGLDLTQLVTGADTNALRWSMHGSNVVRSPVKNKAKSASKDTVTKSRQPEKDIVLGKRKTPFTASITKDSDKGKGK